MNDFVDIHADDYAYTIETSKDIIDCIKNESLDSFSIICNTSYFDESMEMLYKEIPSFSYLPLMSIHLNLPEGLFIGEILPLSWAQLFLSSFKINNKNIKNSLKKEIKYQLDKAQKCIEKCISIAKENNVGCFQKGMRIDSHVHTHMIPIVWNSLVEVIEENDYQIEYIRNSKEPIMPFISNGIFDITNTMKNRILMLFSGKADDFCKKNDLPQSYLWGLEMSGHMDYDRIRKVYPDMFKLASAKNRRLEILFHPGRAAKEEYRKELNADYFNDFNSSKNREIEKDAVMRIKEIITQEFYGK